MAIAVVSFFVIFLFFPDVSYKFFGVSVKKADVGKVIDDTAAGLKDAMDVPKTAGDYAKEVLDNIEDRITDAATEIVSGVMSNAVTDAVNGAVSDAVSNFQNK